MNKKNLHLSLFLATLRSHHGYSNHPTRPFMTISMSNSPDDKLQTAPALNWSARTKGWRPTKSDVIAISWGKPARHKGTGSRGVPHRLNAEERFAFDQARSKGYLECLGSGYRSTRRDSPLINSWRSFCDANACVCLILHKNGYVAEGDEIVMDLSPLRKEECFESLGKDIMVWMGRYRNVLVQEELTLEYKLETVSDSVEMPSNSDEISSDSDGMTSDSDEMASDSDEFGNEDKNLDLKEDRYFDEISNVSPWETKPIYQLPAYFIRWSNLHRSKAKEICSLLASEFQTKDSNSRPSQKPEHLKPGKGRRSGGYGI